MRSLFAFALFAATLLSLSAVRGDDDLFSEVAMESVFEKATAVKSDVASQTELDSISRITGTSTLVRALKAAGFEPKQDSGRVTFPLEHAGWKFPVAMWVEIERDRIVCEMSLVEIAKDASIDQKALLELLAAGDAARGAFFAYEQSNRLIQLRASLGNRAITANRLKNDVGELAAFAESQSDRWSKLQSETETDPQTTQTAKDSYSLVGTWSAALAGNQAFAIRIESNGQFRLVHLKSGKTTTSKGKASRSGNQLTLAGDDGNTLNCSISWSDAKQFQLAINDAQGKATVKLDFKKKP